MFVRSVYLQGLLLMPEDTIPDFLRPVVPVRRRLEQLDRLVRKIPIIGYVIGGALTFTSPRGSARDSTWFTRSLA